MTHRQVEGSPESGSRITPNSSSPAASPILAAPASEQGEREAFEAWWKGDDGLAKFYAWGAWQARASLRASTQPAVSAEARDARLVSDLSLLVNRMARRLSRRAGGEGTEAGDREMARQASEFLRRKNLASPLRDDAAMGTPPAADKPDDTIYRGQCPDGSRCLHGCHRTEACYSKGQQ